MSPRKLGKRYPNGRLKPQPIEWLPFRQEYLIINRVHDGSKYRTSLRDGGATALDRLHHRQLISDGQHMAGQEFLAVWLWYRYTYAGLPAPYAKTAALELGLFGHLEDDRFSIRAAKEYYRARKALGPTVEPTIDVCVYDQDPPQWKLFMVKRGLKALAQHFGF